MGATAPLHAADRTFGIKKAPNVLFSKMPGREPRQHDRSGAAGRRDDGAPTGICATPVGTLGCSQDRRDGQILDASSPVVRALLQISALAWWRLVLAEGTELEPALQGDATAAIAIALSLMPITQLGGIKTDIAMTVVLSIALEGEPRCALLLAHVIDRAEHDPRRADQLCGSWLEFHFDSSGCHSGFAPEQKTLRKFDATPIVTTADLQFAHTGGTVLT